jgi:hypothetical protein
MRLGYPPIHVQSNLSMRGIPRTFRDAVRSRRNGGNPNEHYRGYGADDYAAAQILGDVTFVGPTVG